MAKKNHRRKRRIGLFITIILSLVALIGIILLWQVFGQGSSHITGKEVAQSNALSTQVITTTTTAKTTTGNTTKSTTISSWSKSRQTETTRVNTTQNTETTEQEVETIDGAETRTTTPNLTRLDKVGNSGLEFDTLDEASDYAERFVQDRGAVADLKRKGYSGYVIRAVRWSNNTVTYTIDWTR